MAINYKRAYQNLLQLAQKRGLTIVLVPKNILKDYAGMNSEAARDMGFNMPDDTIYLAKSLSPKIRYETLRHEISEVFEMKKGKSYWDAHQMSLGVEKTRCHRALWV